MKRSFIVFLFTLFFASSFSQFFDDKITFYRIREEFSHVRIFDIELMSIVSEEETSAILFLDISSNGSGFLILYLGTEKVRFEIEGNKKLNNNSYILTLNNGSNKKVTGMIEVNKDNNRLLTFSLTNDKNLNQIIYHHND